jgi:hypothetical protein
MERGEELMQLNRNELELNRAAAVRNTEAFKRMMAAFDQFDRRLEESRSEKDDLKTFIREMNLRSEKVIQDLLRRGEEFMMEQRKRTEEIVAELQDGRAERKAQTEALLALIDRLPPPAQAA